MGDLNDGEQGTIVLQTGLHKGRRSIIQGLLWESNIESAADIQEA